MRRALVVLALVMAGCSTAATSTTDATTEASSTVPPTATVPSTTTSQTAENPATRPEGEEVQFTSGGLELVGNLRLPIDHWPAPAVVLIHGSGPLNRDSPMTGQLNMQFGFAIPVFAEIAVGLQNEGIGVLTYDKRTCGTFNGCSDNDYPLPSGDLRVDSFIADAQAAVDYLRSRPEIDPERISVIGHSQGAQFIPIMLQADPRLASGVMMAGAFRPIDQIIRAQFDSTIDLLGALGISRDDALASPGVAALGEMADGVKAIRRGSEDSVAGTSAAFWRSWFDLQEQSQAAAAAIDQPMMVLHGELDWNVDVSEARAWGTLLTEVGADHQVVTLPCVTHALNCVAESDPTAITPDDLGGEVAPEVIDALVEFLSG